MRSQSSLGRTEVVEQPRSDRCWRRPTLRIASRASAGTEQGVGGEFSACLEAKCRITAGSRIPETGRIQEVEQDTKTRQFECGRALADISGTRGHEATAVHLDSSRNPVGCTEKRANDRLAG